MKPCKHNPPVAECRLCWLFDNDPYHNTIWGGDGTLRPSLWQQAVNLAGAVVRHVADGLAKADDAELARRRAICHSCEHHADGRCGKCGCFTAVKAAWESETCPLGRWDRPTRHLLYHVWPVRGNGVWQRNLEQLAARLHLFNGRRVIAVVVDSSTDPAEAVREHLAGHDGIEWQTFGNNAGLREVTTWHALWDQVQSYNGPADFTFYAHAKGVTKPVNVGVAIHPWVRMMYAANLDYWPLVHDLLGRHPVVGAFKKVGHGFAGSRSSWHYSGTFFWVRNRDALPRVREIDWQWWGTESWPGLHFPADQAACLFHEGQVPGLNLYDLAYVRQVEEEFERWKQEKRPFLSVTGSSAT